MGFNTSGNWNIPTALNALHGGAAQEFFRSLQANHAFFETSISIPHRMTDAQTDLYAQLKSIERMKYSDELLACNHCDKTDADPKLGFVKKGYYKFLIHYENFFDGIGTKLFGEEISNDANWTGKKGWEKFGYPTMVKTWSVLGTGVTLGSYGMFANTWAWTAGEFSWNTVSLGVNVYGAVNSFTNYNGPPFQHMGRIGLGVNLYDAAASKDPTAIIGLGFSFYDWRKDYGYFKKLKSK